MFKFLSILGFVAYVSLFVGSFCLWWHGVALAFGASVILGVICLFLEVPFLIFGILDWAFHIDLAHRLVEILPFLK